MVQAGANNHLGLSKERLQHLVPLSTLSPAGLATLASVLEIEQINRGVDPTRQGRSMQVFYLLAGDLGMRYHNGKKVIVRAGSAAARHPINTDRLGIKDTIALTAIEIVRIDLDVLTVSQTWDQMIKLTNRMHGQLKEVLQRVVFEQRQW